MELVESAFLICQFVGVSTNRPTDLSDDCSSIPRKLPAGAAGIATTVYVRNLFSGLWLLEIVLSEGRHTARTVIGPFMGSCVHKHGIVSNSDTITTERARPSGPISTTSRAGPVLRSPGAFQRSLITPISQSQSRHHELGRAGPFCILC